MLKSPSISSWPARLAVGALLATLLAGAASAQSVPYGCVKVKDPNSTAEGAIIGGIAGALLGSAVAGHHHKGEGAVVGGVGGAVAGQHVTCPEGYYYAPPPPPPAYEEPAFAPAPYGDVWYGAPPRIHERIAFLRSQVARVDQDGWLSPRERSRLYHRLDEIQHEEDGDRYHNGGYLTPPEREHLFNELNDVARRIHWDEYMSEHPRPY
jgi:Glycine zipper 2TM domain